MGTEIIQPLTLISNYENSKLYYVSINLENLKVLELKDDLEWALTVAVNREKINPKRYKKIIDKYNDLLNKYDVIFGSIADDRIFYVLDLFFNGTVTDKGLIECLTVLNLGKQIVAKTQNACSNIKIIKEFNLSVLELYALKDLFEDNRKIEIEKANEISKKYRRDGKYFGEILEEV